ncbi:MAG: hypothetical protein H8E00_00540, partial [Deltaproteobacteria bacterium]|nr:hypothetical protein [Deltaproteobacteria bacterium]
DKARFDKQQSTADLTPFFKLAEDDNGHVDWGDLETDDVLGTNSEISGYLSSGTYTIGVTTKRFTSGNYYLVVRDIGNWNNIETICEKRWKKYPAVFPGPSYAYGTPNDWVAELHLVGGDDCVGRCGKGNLDGFIDCWNTYRYTRDCFNHDVCVGRYGQTHCARILDSCIDDCFYAANCGPDLNVGKSDSCDYSKIQFAIDAANSGTAITIESGIYSEHLTSTPETVILRGGWDHTFSTNSSTSTSTNSSTSTVNSLTITDGEIIVDNLVIQ